jgi:hypothetical protein
VDEHSLSNYRKVDEATVRLGHGVRGKAEDGQPHQEDTHLIVLPNNGLKTEIRAPQRRVAPFNRSREVFHVMVMYNRAC